MDEVNTSAGDTPITPAPEIATLEKVEAPLADSSLSTVEAADPETVQRLPSYTDPELAPQVIQGPPLDNLTVVPIETVPPLPTIQVEPVTTAPAVPTQAVEEPRVVERVVEKIVEKEVIKEVIKEVPVEKIIEKEKIVYRDAPSTVCPPPTAEEREAIKRDFLIELSHEGTATRHELMLEKLDTIMTLFDTKEHIMRENVMDVLDCSTTTATRLLTELRHEGKLVLHGTGGNGATYTKNS